MQKFFGLRNVFLIAQIIAGIALCSAYISQYWYGLQPCFLCLVQRYIFIIIIGLVAVGLYLKRGQLKILGGIAGVYFLNAIIAFYQVLIEKKFIAPSEVCEKAELSVNSFNDFKKQPITFPSSSCTEVQWELFGISMAGYNFLLCLGMGMLLLFFLFKHVKSLKT